MPELTAASLTDTGRVRKMNQDSMLVLSADQLECRLDGLYVVADGMGGMAGGEIASRVTVETVPDVVQEVLNEQTDGAGPQALAEALREALEAANNAVFTQARANPELRGMGTTCVAALIRDGQAVIGNVGDSRIYLFRHGRLEQLTDDHSLVQEHVRAGELTEQEARESRYKNVITRAVGIARSVEPDIELVDLEPGDTLLLCSDGLTNMVPEPEIERLLDDIDVADACKRLVDAANRNGGADNITTVIVRYGPYVPASFAEAPAGLPASSVLQLPPTAVRPQSRVGTIVLSALVLILAVALFTVGRDVYHFTTGWPFIAHNSPPKPVVAPPPAPPDYAHLSYSDPVVVMNKGVRGAPVACDATGNVFVIASESGTVLKVSPDGKSSVFVASDAVPKPYHVNRHWATDSQGNMYVSSFVEKRITKYDPTGTRLGSPGEGKLKGPEGLAVDAKGDIYVADNGRLKVLLAQSPSSQSNRGNSDGAR